MVIEQNEWWKIVTEVEPIDTNKFQWYFKIYLLAKFQSLYKAEEYYKYLPC